MDRAEAAGFGVALGGHVALLAVLTLGLATVSGPPIASNPIEVSFVDEVGLTSAAPEPVTSPPEQGMAPLTGPPEDAAAALPEPAPPVAQPPRPSAQPQPKQPPVRQREARPAAPARNEVDVRVTLTRDGSLADADVLRVRNPDSDLAHYERRMRDLALNVIRQCTPIRGLPGELYDVPRGWREFTYTFDPRQS